jgi:hypothetical protein
MSSNGLVEIGKGIIAFANILTALALINIVYNQKEPLFYTILVGINYIFLYYVGYKFIKKGDIEDD